MNNTKMDEQLLKQTIAANLARYRKLNNMTQAELATQISYSDKSVSKWERAEGVPDIFVLTLLAELYGVTVNDFLSENEPLALPPSPGKNMPRIIVLLLSIGLAWLVATIAFTALRLILPSFDLAWLAFILAIPASCIIAVVFTSLWWNMLPLFFSVSLLLWSLALCVHIIISIKNITLIYAIAAVMQILVLLWFILKKQTRRVQKCQ